MSHSAVSVTSGFLTACHMSKNVALTIQIFVSVGPDPPFKKKVKPNEEEKKEEKKKRKRNQNVVQQKANLNVHRAVFRMHGSVNLADLSLTRKAKFVWCVCV